MDTTKPSITATRTTVEREVVQKVQEPRIRLELVMTEKEAEYVKFMFGRVGGGLRTEVGGNTKLRRFNDSIYHSLDLQGVAGSPWSRFLSDYVTMNLVDEAE